MQIQKMNVPDFLAPWLDRFYEPLEIDLLQILASKSLEKKQIGMLLEKNKTLKDYNNFDLFLERAWQKMD
ncbi:MAG: hypothetical protein PF503_03185 [Desulfobacula sp.]|jgi:hypothetical protein|nr:hypothetical protein [Desulfobacula sp.]